MKKYFTFGIGLLLLASMAPAARAGSPGIVEVADPPIWHVVAAAPQQPWEINGPGGDSNADRELSLRFAERGGGKVGAAVGLAVGGSVGFALFGTPGAALFGAVGAFCGEVFGEFAASNLFNPKRVPYMPPLNAPLIPTR